MNFENIGYEVKNQVALVTVNRPKVLNAMNAATLNELEAAFRAAKSDDAVRVVILTGSGEKAFVAGADIQELNALSGPGGKELSLRGQSLFSFIENLGKPVLAAVNGFALGGGCELALACSMRFASENAKFGQPEVKIGIIAGYGGSQRLPRLVGKGMGTQLLLTGEIISAQEALRIGLVNAVVPPAELMSYVEGVAQKIVANAPLAIRHTLEAVNHGLDMTLAEGLYLEATLFSITCSTEDKNEGTSAFLEKRAPNFRGK